MLAKKKTTKEAWVVLNMNRISPYNNIIIIKGLSIIYKVIMQGKLIAVATLRTY